jgi:serine/threonine protein kinase
MAIRQIGSTVCSGKYRVDRILGEGGMAVVYAVTQPAVAKKYALKMLHSRLLESESAVRFLREGEVANSVDHQGAVEVFDVGIDNDGSPFLVMELLEGANVEDLGPGSGIPIDLPSALCITYQTLEVLIAAHRSGIVHRDIKPANLFIKQDGRLKVLDFGISRRGSGSAATTGAGFWLGTPAFMAPEQASADFGGVDARTDVFSVGATLFTMISGELLRDGEHPQQVIVRAATEPARSLAGILPSVPQAVVELVAKAVAFDRTSRWVSAAAMQVAVRTVHEELFGTMNLELLSARIRNHLLHANCRATDSTLCSDDPPVRAPLAARRGSAAQIPSFAPLSRVSGFAAVMAALRSQSGVRHHLPRWAGGIALITLCVLVLLWKPAESAEARPSAHVLRPPLREVGPSLPTTIPPSSTRPDDLTSLSSTAVVPRAGQHAARPSRPLKERHAETARTPHLPEPRKMDKSIGRR